MWLNIDNVSYMYILSVLLSEVVKEEDSIEG